MKSMAVLLVVVIAVAGASELRDQPIHLAAKRGDLVSVQKMVANDRGALNDLGYYQRTPLLCATSVSGGEMVAYWLIKFGASLKSDVLGMSPLHYAASSGQLSVVELLVKRLDVNSKGGAGLTPLHLAVRSRPGSDSKRVAVVSLLLARGAKVDARDVKGKTPLHYAAEFPMDEKGEIVDLLISKKADPNARDAATLLPADCCRVQSIIIRLVERVSPALPSLQSCVRSGRVEWVKKRARLHPDELNEKTGSTCNTPLHAAVLSGSTGREEVLCALLELGAKNLKNKAGYTPADYAFAAVWPLPFLKKYGYNPVKRIPSPPHVHSSTCKH